MTIQSWFPAWSWLSRYDKSQFQSDLLASVIVTIMLIPQSLAYAMLAGLPAEMGLYASILPLVAYSIFGSSRTLAVGPVAVVSMMTAAAAAEFALPGSTEYVGIVILLALVSGLFLIAMGLLRLGFLSNLLSHPVISGFISASALLIAISQLKHLMGVKAEGHSLYELLLSLGQQLPATNMPSLIIGSLSILALLWIRTQLSRHLINFGVSPATASMMVKAGPVVVVMMATLAVLAFSLDQQAVALVGAVPAGFPDISMPELNIGNMMELLPAAMLISLVGFVESISVAQSFAARRRETIDPNQELIGLGTANLASAISSGFPVTGGFSRSVVSFDAGARTPMTGILTAIFILLTLTFLTPVFYYLPKAVLAATIIVAVLSLVDLATVRKVWNYSKQDFAAMAGTIFMVLFMGVEAGIITGVALSLLLFLWHTSHPHIAVVGQIPGTEHFRNIERHKVVTDPHVLTIRIDENLFFANARVLEDKITNLMAERPHITDIVLMCTAVNMIDTSALESLEGLSDQLKAANVRLHLSEVKGPVMDKLRHSDLNKHLSGQIFLTQHQAMVELTVPDKEQ